MNEDAFNMSVRKFLKKVGVTAQREIETAVRTAVAEGRIEGDASLPAVVLLQVEALGLSVTIDGDLDLEVGGVARLVALVVLAAAAAMVVLWHRHDLWPPPAAAPSVPPELQACLDERLGQVETLRAEGTITAEQAGQFAGRAEALCRAQFGESGPPDPPPGL